MLATFVIFILPASVLRGIAGCVTTYTIEYKSDRSKASKHFIVAEVAFEFLSLSTSRPIVQVCDATKA